MTKVLKGIVSSHVTVTAIFKEGRDGNFSAECPEIPGCVVTGRSKLDVTKKIKAAVEACLMQLLSDAKQQLLNESKQQPPTSLPVKPRASRTRTAGRN